jgi:hypothetical protein
MSKRAQLFSFLITDQTGGFKTVNPASSESRGLTLFVFV